MPTMRQSRTRPLPLSPPYEPTCIGGFRVGMGMGMGGFVKHHNPDYMLLETSRAVYF